MGTDDAFRRHHRDLFRFLARECGDPQAARDAVQEAFLRLHQHGSVDDGKVRAWLFTTGLNVVRDMARARTTRTRLLERHPGRVPGPTAGPDPERELERQEDLARLRRALESLRERERTALLMREEGFKHREIAQALETTTGSVGTLISRALEKLERALIHQGDPK